jgi:hypothetical protein
VADGLTLAARPLVVRYRLVPWSVRLTVVYVLARLLTGVLMMAYAHVQTQNSFTLAHPGYLDYASIWDGAWYRVIALNGYPSTLPIGTDGTVQENAWAFMPAYPFLIRAIMTVTGPGSFEFVAVGLSVVFGWGAVLLARKLFARFLRPGTATFAAVLLAVSPVSAMFQTAYAEAMGLFLLALALWLLVERRYWLMIPVVVVLGFTRPAGLAFALGMLVYLGFRMLRRDDVSVRSFLPPFVVAVVSGLVGLAWPAIAWGVTGVQKAYTDTELVWRAAFIGQKPLTPFLGWAQGVDWWWGFGIRSVAVLLVITVVGTIVVLAFPVGRRLGIEMRSWSIGYFVYLLAVFFPQTSTPRILLPMFPLLAIVAMPRNVVYRVLLVVVSIVLQWVWLYWCWWINGSDWSPP